jgi:cytochrome c
VKTSPTQFLNLCRVCVLVLPLTLGAPAFAATAKPQTTAPQTASPPKDAERNDMLAAASVFNGHALSHECAICHTFDKGGPDKVGPNLFGIVGAHMARDPRYSYSFVLRTMKDRIWTVDALDQWLKQPAAYVPGTVMSYGGMLDPQDRMDLIAYLMTLK